MPTSTRGLLPENTSKLLKTPIFRPKSGTPACAPRKFDTFEGATGPQDCRHEASMLKSGSNSPFLTSTRGLLPENTSKPLKTPIFRLKSGTTVAPRENLTRFKVPQVHKTVGMIYHLETCMAFESLPHLQGVFCHKHSPTRPF